MFTNQGGVSSGQTQLKHLKEKFTAVTKEVGVPMVYLIATESDIYRKPALGMWEHFTKKLNKDCKVDMKDSFYCGDAAGRAKTATSPKDFSDSDIKFAANIGIPFKLPE